MYGRPTRPRSDFYHKITIAKQTDLVGVIALPFWPQANGLGAGRLESLKILRPKLWRPFAAKRCALSIFLFYEKLQEIGFYPWNGASDFV